jgi:hypothetical protein
MDDLKQEYDPGLRISKHFGMGKPHVPIPPEQGARVPLLRARQLG